MDKAMNLTYGDLILIEIALLTFIKTLDLSMQSGQYISELLGKIEYELSSMRKEAEIQLNPPASPANTPPVPHIRP